MSQQGDSGDALGAARRALATRDAALADADAALAQAVTDAHAVAVAAVSRIDAIGAEIDAAASTQPKDGPAGAHEIARQLVAKNRDIAVVVTDAKAAAHAKTAVLKALIDRYRLPGTS